MNNKLKAHSEMRVNILMLKYLPVFMLLILICTVLFADQSWADELQTGFVKDIGNAFHAKSTEYGVKLKGYALGLFKLFLLVGIVVFGVQAALSRSDMGEVIKEFLVMLFFSAFCYVAIVFYQDWTRYILDRSTNISNTIGGTGIELSPMDIGFNILDMTLVAIGRLKWGFSAIVYGLGFIILAGIILCCFALMTARMLVVLCESYIAMNVAVLMLGFGGAHFARDYAINVMRYAISVAFKLLVMQILIGIGISFIKDLTIVEVTFQNLFLLLACAVVLLALIHSLPETVAGIINGSHVGSGVGLAAAAGSVGRTMAASFVAATTAVAGTGKTVAGVSRAAKIASLQGDGGLGGTASQLWKSYQEARQDEQRAGMRPSAMGELRRMGASITDMHSAAMAQNNPDYRSNEYSSNRYSGNPYSSAPPNAAVRNAAPFGSSAGRAQTEADNRSAGPAGAAPGRTPGADRPAQASGPSSGSSATDDVIQHLKSGSGRGAKQ